jgi:hypothetical protein
VANMTDVSGAASTVGRRSVEVRIKKWGRRDFVRKLRQWGKLGGRSNGSGKKHSCSAGRARFISASPGPFQFAKAPRAPARELAVKSV